MDNKIKETLITAGTISAGVITMFAGFYTDSNLTSLYGGALMGFGAGYDFAKEGIRNKTKMNKLEKTSKEL